MTTEEAGMETRISKQEPSSSSIMVLRMDSMLLQKSSVIKSTMDLDTSLISMTLTTMPRRKTSMADQYEAIFVAKTRVRMSLRERGAKKMATVRRTWSMGAMN